MLEQWKIVAWFAIKLVCMGLLRGWKGPAPFHSPLSLLRSAAFFEFVIGGSSHRGAQRTTPSTEITRTQLDDDSLSHHRFIFTGRIKPLDLSAILAYGKKENTADATLPRRQHKHKAQRGLAFYGAVPDPKHLPGFLRARVGWKRRGHFLERHKNPGR